MKKHWLSILTAVLIALVAAPQVLPVAANTTWETRLQSEKPPTAARSPQAPQVGEWVIEAVDWGEDKYFVLGSDRGLRVDAAGHPHIAYGGKSLYYAWHDGEDWQTAIVDSEIELKERGEYSSLALDPDGYPHIGYYNAKDGKMKPTAI